MHDCSAYPHAGIPHDLVSIHIDLYEVFVRPISTVIWNGVCEALVCSWIESGDS